MKEWAPASSVPELASAAFAAAGPGGDTAPRDAAPRDEESFDGRSTLKESARRATLIGLPPHSADHPEAEKVDVEAGDGVPSSRPLMVPGPREHADRPGVTQIPPFGAPIVERLAPGAPRAPVIPAMAIQGARADRSAAPKRKITTTEIDGLWAAPPSEEDETIPRRPRPSELAAAAAATAEATGAHRDARVRTRGEIESKRPAARPVARPAPPALPRKPPSLPAPVPEAQPVEARSGRFDAVETRPPAPGPAPTVPSAAPSAPHAAPTRPTPKPPMKTPAAGPPLPVPTPSPVRPPPLPPSRAATLVSGPLGVPVKPLVAPMSTPVRIRPPLPSGSSEFYIAPSRAQSVTPMHATTLTGVAAPTLPGGARARELVREPLEILPRKIEDPSTLVSAGAVPPDAVAEAPEPELQTLPLPLLPLSATAPVAAPTEPVHVRQGETTEPFPAPINDAALSEAPDGGSEPEPIGPLPPARAPMPSRTLGRLPEPSHPPQRGPSAVDEAPASTPAPPAAVPVIAPTAAIPLIPSPAATPAPPASTPVPARAAPSRPPSSGSSDVNLDVMIDRRRPVPQPVPVPMSSLFGAGGVLIGMVIGAFFVGRASAVPAPRLTARPSLGAVPALARATVPPPPKPCWMVKQPAMWAPRVSRSIPFDAVATRTGGLAIGYARDARVAIGIEVNLASGDVQPRFEDTGDDEIERVAPTPTAEFTVARAGAPGALKSPIEVSPLAAVATPVAALTPFAVGLDGASWALATPPTGAATPLWPLPGDEKVAAASVHPAGEKGYALTFRRGSTAVLGGWIGADRKATGALVNIAGSGGSVGKPAAAWNGREVAVIFADRPDKDGHYEIRIGHAPAGTLPTTTTVLPLPRGGPGGDAFAPEIAGLPDGRWLLMWTEGAPGSRAVRAQTLASDFAPIGDPIALSPPAGNFGQGVIGIAGGRAATVFLSKGSASFELWGAVLQCE